MAYPTSNLAERGGSASGERSGASRNDPLTGIVSPLLRSAAQRVSASLREQMGDGPEMEDLLEDLVRLAQTLESQSDTAWGEIEAEPASQLRRRLLELLRAELIRTWQAADPSPDAATMLERLGAVERLREALEPRRDQHFASRLTGPEGLELVTEIAHDLRSPLTSILFLAETLRRGQSGEINDIQHRQLGIIYSAALGLTSVVSDVIELARGGSRLMDRERTPFSVFEILESVRDIVQPMAEEKGLAMRLSSPEEDQRLGYATAISRVLLNLTSNALNFTEEGFVEITAKELDDVRVEFSVRDTGRGLKPEVLRELYQPFRRSRGRTTFSGSGLGLTICRKLVEAMGSELQLDPNTSQGTRFFFELELPPARRS